MFKWGFICGCVCVYLVSGLYNKQPAAVLIQRIVNCSLLQSVLPSLLLPLLSGSLLPSHCRIASGKAGWTGDGCPRGELLLHEKLVANSTLLKPVTLVLVASIIFQAWCVWRVSLPCTCSWPGLSALPSPSATAEEVNWFTGETSFQNPYQHHLAVFYKLTGRKTQTQPENITSMLELIVNSSSFRIYVPITQHGQTLNVLCFHLSRAFQEKIVGSISK